MLLGALWAIDFSTHSPSKRVCCTIKSVSCSRWYVQVVNQTLKQSDERHSTWLMGSYWSRSLLFSVWCRRSATLSDANPAGRHSTWDCRRLSPRRALSCVPCRLSDQTRRSCLSRYQRQSVLSLSARFRASRNISGRCRKQYGFVDRRRRRGRSSIQQLVRNETFGSRGGSRAGSHDTAPARCWRNRSRRRTSQTAQNYQNDAQIIQDELTTLSLMHGIVANKVHSRTFTFSVLKILVHLP